MDSCIGLRLCAIEWVHQERHTAGARTSPQDTADATMRDAAAGLVKPRGYWTIDAVLGFARSSSVADI